MKKKLYGKKDILGTLLSCWRVQAALPHVRGAGVIDLACGDNRLIRRLGRGAGIDIRDYGDVDLVLHSFASLPFGPDSMDTVAILAALNYVDDIPLVLREIHRILKPDGRFLVSFLHPAVSRVWHRIRDRGLPRTALSREELTAALTPAGFSIAGEYPFMFGLNILYDIRKYSAGECL